MDYLNELKKELNIRIAERQKRYDELTAVTQTAVTEGRSALTAEETTRLNEVRSAIAVLDLDDPAVDGYDKSIHAVQARVADLEAIEARQYQAATLGAPKGGAKVINEERTYRKGGDASFLGDLYAQTFRQGNYWEAESRMQRHMHEFEVEKRDITISAMAGAIPPQYLLDQFAAVARAGRPFLNSLNSLDLPPDGISFIIPRGTTGTAAAMTAEGAGFNEQDAANTDLTSTVNLVTAQQDISRTMLMRGGSVVDQILFPDLMASCAVSANVSALNGNGTAPQHRGVLQVAGISAVTFTSGSPTVALAWPKFADAIQRINSLRFMPATVVYMHPRRWAMITSALDTQGRPAFEFSLTPPNSVFGLGKAAEYGQVVGSLQGLPVITDASIPTNLGAGTNEDIVIVARNTDILFWEDDFMSFTFEQTLSTSPGQVRIAVGQFQLFVPGRYPTAISTIGGTGFTPPAF